ncbi:MAG: hypothetical protein OEM52_12885 [bacterium]|nr:hypothetical protein [bacterium]
MNRDERGGIFQSAVLSALLTSGTTKAVEWKTIDNRRVRAETISMPDFAI